MSGEEHSASLRNQAGSVSNEAQQALRDARASPLHDARVDQDHRQTIHQASTRVETPRLTVSISGPSSKLSLSEKAFSFTATLTYVSAPPPLAEAPHNETTVIFDVEQSPLKRNACQVGSYSLYSSSNCDSESRVPYVQPNVSIRAPREPDGRFKQRVDVTDLSNYVELKVGSSISREVELNLDEGSRGSWHGYLVVGRRYWLRCDSVTGTRGKNESGVDRFWRFGKLAVSLFSTIPECQ